MIRCGWCGRGTPPGPSCTVCGHQDPGRPYLQRGLPIPRLEATEGRPRLSPADVARRLAAARRQLGEAGRPETVEALAEVLDVSPRTVRRWRELAR